MKITDLNNVLEYTEYSPGVSAEVDTSGNVVYSKPNNDMYSSGVHGEVDTSGNVVYSKPNTNYTPTPTPTPNIPNSENGKVSIRSIQSALVQAGYNIGPTGVDGKKGKYTLAAIEKFKTDNNLPDNNTAVRTLIQPSTQLSELFDIKKLSGL